MTRPDTAAQLAEIADLLPYLPLMATTRNPLDGEPGRGAPVSKPPLSLDPLVLAEDVHATFVSWIMLAHDEQLVDADDWPADSTLACCMWLQRHCAALCAHLAGDEWRSEVRHLWGRVRRAVGERSPRPPRCPRTIAGQTCGNALDGINTDGDRTDIMEHWTWCRCPACGATYTLKEGLERLGRMQDATIAELAEILAVPVSTLHHWHKTGLIQPVGKRAGVRVFAIEDVRHVASARPRATA